MTPPAPIGTEPPPKRRNVVRFVRRVRNEDASTA
jgi:hypothetical protein